MSWWKKKPKEDLELKEEEREASLTTPLGGFRRKRVYAVKKDTPSEKPQENAQNPRIFEATVTIAPNHYEPIELGELPRGTTISLECSEKEGQNFSFLILDADNFKNYKKTGGAPKSLAKGSGEDEYKEKVTVSIAGRYYLVLTSRATDYKRKVWYRVEIS
jgi:hypothetical protein